MHSERGISKYRCTCIDRDPIDWPNLDEAIDVLRPTVPLVSAVEVHAATAEGAVKKVLENMGVPSEKIEKVSIARQAYMLRAMFSALRKIKRNPRRKNVHPGIMELAALMQYLPKKLKADEQTTGPKPLAVEVKVEARAEVKVKLEAGETPRKCVSRRRPSMTTPGPHAPPLEKAEQKRCKAADVWASAEAAMQGGDGADEAH